MNIDWLHITARNLSLNSGDDIAGTIHAFGSNVKATAEFHIGDRVAAFHPMLSPGGAYAEYAIAPQHSVFKIPDCTSFEEAATVPLVSITAALSLFKLQGLPPPCSPRTSSSPQIPLIIYGASSALGSFAIKLAKLSNIHPVIAICGGTQEYVKSLLDFSKGDAVVDHRAGIEPMKTAVKAAVAGLEVLHALDAISSNGTWIPLSQLLSPGGQVSVVSGANRYDDPEIPERVKIKYTYVGAVHTGAYLSGMPKQPADKQVMESAPDFAFVLFRFLGRVMAEDRFEGHPFEVVPGGLGGVEAGLRQLKSGNSKGVKFVYRVEDTFRD